MVSELKESKSDVSQSMGKTMLSKDNVERIDGASTDVQEIICSKMDVEGSHSVNNNTNKASVLSRIAASKKSDNIEKSDRIAASKKSERIKSERIVASKKSAESSKKSGSKKSGSKKSGSKKFGDLPKRSANLKSENLLEWGNCSVSEKSAKLLSRDSSKPCLPKDNLSDDGALSDDGDLSEGINSSEDSLQKSVNASKKSDASPKPNDSQSSGCSTADVDNRKKNVDTNGKDDVKKTHANVKEAIPNAQKDANGRKILRKANADDNHISLTLNRDEVVAKRLDKKRSVPLGLGKKETLHPNGRCPNGRCFDADGLSNTNHFRAKLTSQCL